ncbi:MAG: [FeFe] hydrogenase H-cluster radical SAM maturase HydE [Bacteroidales bacterium]|jgi:biotin synthase|nr:[FeFe] hydrogenase H-cluster radical SAM maturase HydE [Bacteroidales bacterium]MDD2323538.1 [FeFe] hydrogenase H-cluster radical SAM maturase HydE [Bacteroidales bacterium]MDD3011505.1 [FeFe] hydrogenase H-cluster radical SAM maturase HydE [Bacteroidales bacterium]MDD3961551.1 [FeFe] hydrogenase H-cluster radical SAM maturase HydE [Bacteroidales bacterium]MDY0285039.1 [FeFe] hydrogenase H-cluster radical SAM maturase HydE [Bacteroidales bacterium]
MDLNKKNFSRDELVELLRTPVEEAQPLFDKALEIKRQTLGDEVYLRGLLEYSNRCAKNCFYCGVRCARKDLHRYEMTLEEVRSATRYAVENRFASMVIQAGERSNPAFVNSITRVLDCINRESNSSIAVTLSLGEQSEDTFRKWHDHGATRYLLRIESSNPDLYHKIHPNDRLHSYKKRVEALTVLQKTGYQVGTGVMIGLPFQTLEDLADDLIFFKEMDIDMFGMGPYIEHHATPLYPYRHLLLPEEERFWLSIKMIAVLRLLVNDANMAATTAMQTLYKGGREKAMLAGANVIMPNLTPLKYREDYLLYENKPGLDQEIEDTVKNLEAVIIGLGLTVGFGHKGDPQHFYNRIKKQSNAQKSTPPFTGES